MSAVAVFCGSSIGNQPDFLSATESLGMAMAMNDRPLVYGGGTKGLMGLISATVLKYHGRVTGVIPYAMVAAGGEGSQVESTGSQHTTPLLNPEQIENIVVDSMHERKVVMAQRSDAFIGLPGGFGSFEEICEAVTWTQIGIHNKPVVLINVRCFWNPLRQMVNNAVEAGFISQKNRDLLVFVDGPESLDAHGKYDWGTAALAAIDEWKSKRTETRGLFDWSRKRDGSKMDALGAS